MTDQQAVEHFDKIDSALAQGKLPETIPNLCQIYHDIEGPLRLLLPVIGSIPTHGKTIVAAIELLLKLADQACPRN